MARWRSCCWLGPGPLFLPRRFLSPSLSWHVHTSQLPAPPRTFHALPHAVLFFCVGKFYGSLLPTPSQAPFSLTRTHSHLHWDSGWGKDLPPRALCSDYHSLLVHQLAVSGATSSVDMFLSDLWILSVETWVSAVSPTSTEVRDSYFNTWTLSGHLSRSLSFTNAIHPRLWVVLQAGPFACTRSHDRLFPRWSSCLSPILATAPKSHLSHETETPLPLLSQGRLAPHLALLALWPQFLASGRPFPFVSPQSSQTALTMLLPAGLSFPTNTFLLEHCWVSGSLKGFDEFFLCP